MPRGVYVRSEAHKEKLRQQLVIGRAAQNEDTRRKKSESHKGLSNGPLSAELKERIGAALRGKKLSAERRAAISAGKKGKPLSEENKRHISDALKGRRRTPEHQAKLTAANRMRGVSWLTDEVREKMRDAHRRHAKLDLPDCLCATHRKRLVYENTQYEKALLVTLAELGISDLIHALDGGVQKYFGHYRADFYSPSRKEAYEADCSYWHSRPDRVMHDQKRDSIIAEKFGVLVIRFTDDECSDVELAIARLAIARGACIGSYTY